MSGKAEEEYLRWWAREDRAVVIVDEIVAEITDCLTKLSNDG